MTTRREKTIAGILIFFAALTLILGFVQIQKTLRAPLLFDAPKKSEQQPIPNRLSAAVDPSKDTDGDGLLDIDELSRHGTSPYLVDSDSDSLNDRVEIEKGTDPNCPEGKQCSLITPQSAAVKKPKTLSDILERDIAPPTAPEDRKASPPSTSTASIAELRAALLAAGVPKDQLDQIDDAKLLEMYQETERDIEKKDTGN